MTRRTETTAMERDAFAGQSGTTTAIARHCRNLDCVQNSGNRTRCRVYEQSVNYGFHPLFNGCKNHCLPQRFVNGYRRQSRSVTSDTYGSRHIPVVTVRPGNATEVSSPPLMARPEWSSDRIVVQETSCLKGTTCCRNQWVVKDE